MLYLFLLPVVWAQAPQYNETEARMMLLLSAGAYADTNNTAMNACVSAALPGDAATISDVSMENCDQLNNPLVTESIRRLYVVFRGTKTDSQLVLEGWSTLENGLGFYGMGLVNKYFKNGHELLWPAVQAVIGDPRYAGYGVTFTGHSLGGALAALAAARAASQGLVPGANIRLITFGEPRVGSAQFAQNFDSLIYYSFRVVFRQDIVPHSPGCKKNKMVARLANGAEQCDPTAVDRPYHHGTEVWYPKSMLPGSNYTVCTGQPKNEDMNCSDQLTFSIGGNEKYIWDHRHYFAVRVPPFGQSGCDTQFPEGYGNNPNQKYGYK